MFLSGVAAVVHDYRWLHQPIKAMVVLLSWRKRSTTAIEEGIASPRTGVEPDTLKDKEPV
ncbi:hypothetical protein J3E68DRAFT_417198 [Trichoderma sp. SZMC 28012]